MKPSEHIQNAAAVPSPRFPESTPSRAPLRLRVLMTADTVGGVWTYAMELCRGLSMQGVEVLLATMGTAVREHQRAEVAAIERVTLAESSYALEWMESPWKDVAEAGEWLLALEKEFRPDVVHLNGYVHAALSWSAPTVIVGHSCVLSWWKAVKGEDAPDTWEHYRASVMEGIQRANQVVAPTGWMLRELERWYGPLGDPRVISNARTLPASQPGKNEPLILCVGRLWDEAKNARCLATAAQGVAWPVWLAGDARGPNGQQAEFPNVRLLGPQSTSEVWSLYHRASIFALPARYEPFGLSALEAAHAGCALVLGDLPSLREVWGSAAVYVPPQDPDALRVALNQLIEDPVALAHYRAAAQQRARRYSPEIMVTAYLEVYTDLLCSARRSRERVESFS